MYPISGLAITKAHKICFRFSCKGLFFDLKIANNLNTKNYTILNLYELYHSQLMT